MTKYKNEVTGKFKSRLERFCNKELIASGLEFKYESWKVELMPKFTSSITSYEKPEKKKEFIVLSPNIRNITYTPDFVGSNWIIETKGKETPDFKIKWKMFKKYIEDNKLNYTLFKPTNQKQIKESIRIIKDKLLCGNLVQQEAQAGIQVQRQRVKQSAMKK